MWGLGRRCRHIYIGLNLLQTLLQTQIINGAPHMTFLLFTIGSCKGTVSCHAAGSLIENMTIVQYVWDDSTDKLVQQDLS